MENGLRVLAPMTGLVPVEALPAGLDFLDGGTPEQVLGSVYFTDYEPLTTATGVGLTLTIVIDGELGIAVPGLPDLKLVVGTAPGGDVTRFRLTALLTEDGFELRADDVRIALRLPPSILRPAPPAGGGTPPPFTEIAVRGSLSIDHHLDVRVDGFDRLSLPPVMVGGTGVILSADDVVLSLSKAHTPPEVLAAGFDPGFIGVFLGEAKIKLPDGLPALAPDSLVLRNAAIGSEGVSGKLEAVYGFAYDPAAKTFTGDGAGALFGVPFGAGTLGIELRHNALVAGGLTGQLLLPFFDHPVAVTVTIHPDGSCAVDLGAAASLGTVEHAGLLRLAVQRLGFEVTGTRLVVHTGGTVTLLVGDLPWPSFKADDIAIDSDGGIVVRGAGVALANGKPLDLGPSPTGSGRTPGVTVDRLAVSGDPLDAGLVVDAEVSAVVDGGPVTASMKGIGAHARLVASPSGDGAVADRLSLHPPGGVGLTVDVQDVLAGGGFLFHDDEHNLYGGAMRLSLHDRISVTAYGLITSGLPDGGPGHSLLIFITADGFQPIPLGFGFTLRGIGGMLGVHRTFDRNALSAGLKTDVLGRILAPRDPSGDAAALSRTLDALFPAQRGSLLLGLLAHITWFTPTLVEMHLALILELGARERLLMLGRVSALLPAKDNDLIRLNVDAMGVLDLDAGTLEADAVLVDSRLVHRFPVTGSAALRARWSGGGESFVLAVGGLNPRFTPPAGFPQLDRVTIALSSGDNPRLICDAYLAVTSNTVQLGARASLHAEAFGCTVTGDVSFDALITLLPPHFIVDFHAGVQVRFHGHNLCKVSLDGTLEGPLPLRLGAKVKFEILWLSFSKHFDFTLADGDGRQAIAAVALADEVAAALADPSGWSTRHPAGPGHGVALRGASPGAHAALDPLGRLVVEQQVAPLNTARDIDTYGGAPVSGPRRLRLEGSLNGRPGTPATGSFAPTRYFAMSDDDKLAAPSFETMDAGLVLSADQAAFDPASMVPAKLTYESITLNPPGAAAAAPPHYTMPAEALQTRADSGAAAYAPVRAAGRTRFRNPAAGPAATLAEPVWRIVRVSDGAAAPVAPGVRTWSEHRAALAVLNRGGARWQMVAAHDA